MRKLAAIAISLCFLSGIAQAAINKNPNNYFCNVYLKNILDKVIQPAIFKSGDTITANTIKSAMVGVYQNKQLCYFSYGSLVHEKDEPPTLKTMYEIGSITKTFTATMLGIKALKGELSPFYPRGSAQLSARVQRNALKIIASQQNPIPVRLPEAYTNTTYAALASFMAGFPDSPPGVSVGSYPQDRLNYTQTDFVIKFLNKNLENYKSTIGTYVYSDAAYGFLGQLLMTIDFRSQKIDWNSPDDFDSWMRTYILQPLQMNCTGVIIPSGCSSQAPSFRFQKDYVKSGGAPWPWTPLGAAGSLRSNIVDMMHYVQAQLNNKKIRSQLGKKITNVPRKLREAMQFTQTQPTPMPNIGKLFKSSLSWNIYPNDQGADPYKHPLVVKNGVTHSFTSLLLLNTKIKAGLVLLINSKNLLDKDLKWKHLWAFGFDINKQMRPLYRTKVKLKSSAPSSLLISSRNGTSLWQINPGGKQKIALPASYENDIHELNFTIQGQSCLIKVDVNGNWQAASGCSPFFKIQFPKTPNKGKLVINYVSNI